MFFLVGFLLLAGNFFLQYYFMYHGARTPVPSLGQVNSFGIHGATVYVNNADLILLDLFSWGPFFAFGVAAIMKGGKYYFKRK